MSLVLIVEDNERNLKLVRDVLQAKGYATLEAGTAEEGLELARERAPALILMDIHLPGMSGIEALKALRAEVATASIPVIAITASVMQESLREVMAAGFDDLIEKPINVLGFLDKVRSLLGAAAP
jgi:two-component system cell cycle response regulator DivK